MIGTIFMFGNDMVEVRVNENNVLFRSGAQPIWATIEGLQLNKAGVIKEFPDLEGDDTWREQAIERFKGEIKKIKSERHRMDYIIRDLEKHGYVPKYEQKGGHRPKRIG